MAVEAASRIAEQLGFEPPSGDVALAMMAAYRQQKYRDLVGGGVEYRYHVPGGSLNVNFAELKNVRWEVYLSLGYAILNGSGPDVIITAAAHVISKMNVLPEAEADVVNEILRTPPRRAYSVPIDEAAFRATYQDATVSIDGLLDSLEKKNVIVRRGGGILLTF